MKERGGYEYYGSSLKESLGIGTTFVWEVGKGVYKGVEPIVRREVQMSIYKYVAKRRGEWYG